MNYDDRLANRTPLVARCVAMVDRHGVDVITAIAKATYEVSPVGECTLSSSPRRIRIGDDPYPEEAPRQVRSASDFFDELPGTSVIFVGTAHPPPRVTSHVISVRAGKLFKAVVMTGACRFTANRLGTITTSAPAPLEPTPITYGRAYGGTDDHDPHDEVRFEKNPVGRGFAQDPTFLIGKPAPMFACHQVHPTDSNTEPAGFGPIHSDWSPREERRGTRDAAWARTRAPVVPKDFDPRHHSAAHPDLYSHEPLPPDVPIEVVGATPEGAWRFRLPAWEPRFSAFVLRQEIELASHADTIFIDGDAGVVEVTWRASMRLPRKAEHLGSMVIYELEPLPEAVTGPRPAPSPQPSAET